ncbi:MAG TPA: hypothetical protein VFL92_01895 [Sphingomonas sp.]|nr:hypothetical protein [Sphingomonas sp.]
MIPSLLLLALLQSVAPPATGPEITVTGRTECGPPFATLYIAPMGEPSRTDGFTDPMAQWFGRADADHDGKLTWPEFAADADRFFDTIDLDHSGEIDPQEMQHYEYEVAPEIKLYQPGQDRRGLKGRARRRAREAAKARADYVAPYGAGEYASLNIPEPVASADLDLNRGVSRKEFAKVAGDRFVLLDPDHRGYLTLDTLPKSPAQEEIDACRAKAEKKRR